MNDPIPPPTGKNCLIVAMLVLGFFISTVCCLWVMLIIATGGRLYGNPFMLIRAMPAA